MATNKQHRDLYFYKHYYLSFFKTQTEEVKTKKKTQKTPKNEIELARKIKNEYFYEKQ